MKPIAHFVEGVWIERKDIFHLRTYSTMSRAKKLKETFILIQIQIIFAFLFVILCTYPHLILNLLLHYHMMMSLIKDIAYLLLDEIISFSQLFSLSFLLNKFILCILHVLNISILIISLYSFIPNITRKFKRNGKSFPLR